ncbi:hypothetical protein AK973_3238 [Pseudomonas brassicacearum]|nr:hypothetical protein AK973_3238 [Pseudomonas brassicacearum]
MVIVKAHGRCHGVVLFKGLEGPLPMPFTSWRRFDSEL